MARAILRDGRVAELREARDDERDRMLIRDLFRRASPNSLYLRFFHMVREVSDEAIDGMVRGRGPDGLSLLCVAGDRALGIGTYTPVDEDTAEVAFLVDDELQGKGLGTLLLEHLAQRAWRHGFTRFEAYVLAENQKMLDVFHSSGYEVKRRLEYNQYHLVLPLGETERSRALKEAREKLATAASLHPFFRPRTVAVIGASRDPDSLGHLLLRNVIAGNFRGVVYPVNPHAEAVAGVKAYPSVGEVPDRIDLAVIAVPAGQVLPVVDDCVEAGVRAVTILSSGFAEQGEEGRALQDAVVGRLRAAGCRLIGPNCLGLLTTDPDVRLNASFAPHPLRRGRLAIASHSGGLGVAILEYAERAGIGVSSFVSLGNKADVSGNDVLQYWEDDPATDLVVLYLESFGNPRKFSRIARRVTRRKPVLVVKSARTPAGAMVSEARAAAAQASDSAVEALFQQTGILRMDTLQELFDAAVLLAFAPLPKGRRVAVVTNSAGGAVIAVDALRREGLEFVSPLIDLGFEALAEGYRLVLPQVLRDPEVDAVLVLFVPVGSRDEQAVAQAIEDAIREAAGADPTAGNAAAGVGEAKPVIATFLTTDEYMVRTLDAGVQQVPVYPFPEQAVRALAKAAQYAEYRAKTPGRIPDLAGIACDAARQRIRAAQGEDARWLSAEEAHAVLGCAGIVAAGDEADPVEERAGSPVLVLGIDVDPLFGPLLFARRADSPEPTWDPQEIRPPRTCVRLVPITDVDAREMAGVLMNADDPGTGADLLPDLLLRLSRLADEVPEVLSVRALARWTGRAWRVRDVRLQAAGRSGT
ncbi:MAG: bifunctional GNAT family N-acetyltransferase/acetate--CoA ligase family protein [Alicyclobacillus macrosporangiidus]|uniref:bifunctional acetate--CoA ligase family protein/GNAT family N-acetyltransferase n=1 Tax=Alicyclobacillus macrosporangiidus TaxID=392015 RepID=UPI0026F1EE68|nr:GNAT family N-acetyltransferase [Alicyclobacillus macrosporangiidus]MCL6600643.1 bifunctional GNAT family N-acetyltransferase/acetate--CoA ligase family protein [Alicyclobacillus macrosporangiidus]